MNYLERVKILVGAVLITPCILCLIPLVIVILGSDGWYIVESKFPGLYSIYNSPTSGMTELIGLLGIAGAILINSVKMKNNNEQ